MTTTQHTPGPWRLAWGKIVDQSDKAVCLLAPRKGALNSHLIASAPDLLSALVALLEQADLGEVDEETAPIVEAARAAIAKAEGRAE